MELVREARSVGAGRGVGEVYEEICDGEQKNIKGTSWVPTQPLAFSFNGYASGNLRGYAHWFKKKKKKNSSYLIFKGQAKDHHHYSSVSSTEYTAAVAYTAVSNAYLPWLPMRKAHHIGIIGL